MQTVHTILNCPCGYGTQQSQTDAQHHTQGGIGGKVIAKADAAEKTDTAAQGTEQEGVACVAQVHFPHTGNGSGNLEAKFCVRNAGCVQHVTAGEEGVEAAVFEGGTLVVHVHAFLQVNTALLVRINAQIAKLCPCKDHHGQVRACGGQMAAELTGGNALQQLGAALADQRQTAHQKQPVNKRGSGTDGHGDSFRIAVTENDHFAGEHFFVYFQNQRQTFSVLQGTGHCTGDQTAAGDTVDDGVNIGLQETAGEGGLFAAHITGHGDGEGQCLYRIVKAAKQRHTHNQRTLSGGFVALCVQHIGERVTEGYRVFAHVTVKEGKIHQNSVGIGGAAVGAGGGTVDGNILRTTGKGEGQTGDRVIHIDAYSHGYLTGAV